MPENEFFKKKGPFPLSEIAKAIGCDINLKKNEVLKIQILILHFLKSKINYLLKSLKNLQ